MSWRLFWKIDLAICLLLISGVLIVGGTPEKHTLAAALMAVVAACTVTSVLFVQFCSLSGSGMQKGGVGRGTLRCRRPVSV